MGPGRTGASRRSIPADRRWREYLGGKESNGMTNPIVQAALNVKTVSDVERIESAICKELGTFQFRCLGDLQANFSALDSPGDATALWVERATNMFDGVIELEAQLRKEFD